MHQRIEPESAPQPARKEHAGPDDSHARHHQEPDRHGARARILELQSAADDGEQHEARQPDHPIQENSRDRFGLARRVLGHVVRLDHVAPHRTGRHEQIEKVARVTELQGFPIGDRDILCLEHPDEAQRLNDPDGQKNDERHADQALVAGLPDLAHLVPVQPAEHPRQGHGADRDPHPVPQPSLEPFGHGYCRQRAKACSAGRSPAAIRATAPTWLPPDRDRSREAPIYRGTP